MARSRDRFLSDDEIASASPEELAQHFMPLAQRLAANVRKDCADTQADAYLGLVRAAEHYDPAKGRFAPYATLWIRQAITRGAGGQRHAIWLPPSVRRRLAEVLDARNRLGDDATHEQIASVLGEEWTAGQVTRVLNASRAVPAPADPDGGDTLEEFSEDDGSQDAMIARVDLERIMDGLPGYLADSVRDWLDGDTDERDMATLAGQVRAYLDGDTLA